MMIRREILNMSVKNWDRLSKIFGEDKNFEVTPNEFLHIIGLPGVSSSIPNTNEQEFFKQIYAIAYQRMIDKKEETMNDEINSIKDPVIFDKSMVRRCLSYFQGCKSFDENSFGTDKQCMSYSFGCMTIKCGFYEKGSKPVQINTSSNIIPIGTKTNKELKNNMTKKLTEAQKAEKKLNKTKPVVEENTPADQFVEPVIEEPKTEDVQKEDTPVEETKSKKASKTEKISKAEKAPKAPKGEGAVAKIEAMILDIVGKAGKMTVKAVNDACPAEFNPATWQVRIYHLRKANKLSYNKETKEVSVV